MAAPRAPAVGGSTSKHSIKAARFSPPALMRLPMPDALQQPTSIGPFRDLFRRTIELKAVRVNEHDVGKVKKLASDREIVMVAGLKSVVPDPSSATHRLVVLNTNDLSSIPQDALPRLEAIGTFVPHSIQIDYRYFTTEEVLDAVLPEPLLDEVPASFSAIGHIAHLNLREDYLPYRHLIAEVIMDKSHSIETVVNKLEGIHAEYRNFDLEVLAGRPDTNVLLSEGGCTFSFDFSKVYFNSRLSTEHGIVVSHIPPSALVIDAFAGVGPFAIPLAKKGCAVVASDLNPDSVEALRDATERNGVADRCRIRIGDGRKVMRDAVVDVWRAPFPANFGAWKSKNQQAREKRRPPGSPLRKVQAPLPEAPSSSSSRRRLATHFIMNLPDTALNFLDAFRGIYVPLKDRPDFMEALQETGDVEDKMPIVYVYCFTREEDDAAMADINQRAAAVLGHPVSRETVRDYDLFLVRRVAPKKDYYRLSFRIPSKVAFEETTLEARAGLSF